MGVSHEIKQGLTEAIEYEKGNLKAKETTLTTKHEDTLTQLTIHARWKKILQKDTHKYTCECSNCGFGKGKVFDTYRDPFCIDDFEYCPHCGFKMDATEVEIKDEQKKQ